jgi:hypothetical protein
MVNTCEIVIATSSISHRGGPFVPDGTLTYWLPDEAIEAVDPILTPHGQEASWYFDKLNHVRGPVPWALVCIDQEYELAGHIAEARIPDAGIAFSSYTYPDPPLQPDCVPKVGVLVLASKTGLRSVANRSPVFAAAWQALEECREDRRWLIVLDPLDESWLREVVPGDSERWLASRRGS